MANVITPTYSFTLPEVGADTNAWGGHLNANFQTIDDQMVSRTKTTAQTIAGALNLPANGLNVGSGQLQVSGGNVSMSGTLTVTGSSTFTGIPSTAIAPTTGNHLTNKTYVDGQVGLKLNLTGGTLTGMLTLSGPPTVALHPATKAYADAIQTTVDGRTITAGTGLTGGGAISTNPTISIPNGGVGATQLATDAVTTAKILDGNVTSAKLAQPFTRMTSQASTGTAIQFTGIPSWAKRVTLIFSSVQIGGSSNPLIQIGTSSGFETTGYNSTSVNANGGSTLFGAGAGVQINLATPGTLMQGSIVLENVASNTWVVSGLLGFPPSNVCVNAGIKGLSGVLDRIRLTTVNGTDSYSAGTLNVFYE